MVIQYLIVNPVTPVKGDYCEDFIIEDGKNKMEVKMPFEKLLDSLTFCGFKFILQTQDCSMVFQR